MNTIKITLKGILLYATIIAGVLYISGIDSIFEEGYFIIATFIVALLIFTCCKTISKKELDILTLDKYFKEKDNDEYIV